MRAARSESIVRRRAPGTRWAAESFRRLDQSCAFETRKLAETRAFGLVEQGQAASVEIIFEKKLVDKAIDKLFQARVCRGKHKPTYRRIKQVHLRRQAGRNSQLFDHSWLKFKVSPLLAWKHLL